MFIAISIVVVLVWILLGIVGFCLYRSYGFEYIEPDLLLLFIFLGAISFVVAIAVVGYERLQKWICNRW